MSDQINEILFDKRVVERNITRGLVTREDYEKYLSSLEDSAEHSIEVEAQFLHREQAKQQ
jgi:hypothetical protein